MQLTALAQETPESTLPAGLTTGVESSFQALPFHDSANATAGLPAELEV